MPFVPNRCSRVKFSFILNEKHRKLIFSQQAQLSNTEIDEASCCGNWGNSVPETNLHFQICYLKFLDEQKLQQIDNRVCE